MSKMSDLHQTIIEWVTDYGVQEAEQMLQEKYQWPMDLVQETMDRVINEAIENGELA